MPSKTFSPNNLMHIRRMRLARRLYKNTPVFALIEMQRLFSGYTENDLWNDLHRRTKAKVKKHKSSLNRYGRYGQMMQLLSQYALSGDPILAIGADKLRQRMTQPYRVQIVLQKQVHEFCFPATTNLFSIQQLTTQLRLCQSLDQVQSLITDFESNAHIN